MKVWTSVARITTLVYLMGFLFLGCLAAQAPTAVPRFRDDVEFMKRHTEIVVLRLGDAAVAIAPAYQGRVMTSTIDGAHGPSFGWINRKVIAAGVISADRRSGKLEDHIHVFGGEERFWLGPEGGQFALFFQPGTKFEFADWRTPAAIDTEPFELVSKSATSAAFKKECELTNFSGTEFSMRIEREIQMLDRDTIADAIKSTNVPDDLRMVGYQSDNRLTNIGARPWVPETGLPSIWLLGMFNPTPTTTVVIPFRRGAESELGPRVNDTYFGKVPPDYLTVKDDVLFFKGDGTRRGKIGITAARSKGIAASFDAANHRLTIVTYNVQEAPFGFVNSMWEMQDEPFKGDVINSYNDGSPAPGEPPLGPFYELETSSPAAALKPGQTMRHLQQTLHITGTNDSIDTITRRLLGVTLNEIRVGNR